MANESDEVCADYDCYSKYPLASPSVIIVMSNTFLIRRVGREDWTGIGSFNDAM